LNFDNQIPILGKKGKLMKVTSKKNTFRRQQFIMILFGVVVFLAIFLLLDIRFRVFGYSEDVGPVRSWIETPSDMVVKMLFALTAIAGLYMLFGLLTCTFFDGYLWNDNTSFNTAIIGLFIACAGYNWWGWGEIWQYIIYIVSVIAVSIRSVVIIRSRYKKIEIKWNQPKKSFLADFTQALIVFLIIVATTILG
jgi:hypothetical protein